MKEGVFSFFSFRLYLAEKRVIVIFNLMLSFDKVCFSLSVQEGGTIWSSLNVHDLDPYYHVH